MTEANLKNAITGRAQRGRNKPLNEMLKKMRITSALISNPYSYSGLGPFIKPRKMEGPKSLKSLRPEIGKTALLKFPLINES